MKKTIHVLIIALFALTSCAEPIVETFGSISGYVVDESTGAALSGARVTMTPTGSSQITSTDGEFLFDNLDPQEYTLSIKKDGYEDMSQKVSVKAGVTTSVQVALKQVQPVLNVSVSTLDFGDEITSLVMDITNSGKGVLEWVIDEDIEWITCSPTSGYTSHKNSSVVVKASREGMERGNYTETIVISSNGGSGIVKVKIAVGNSIKISVDPDELDFGSLENQMQLKITNNGNSAVSYTAEAENNWLVLSKTSGSVLTSEYMNVIVSREGLGAGSYTSSIKISTDGGELAIPVKMQIVAKSKPAVSMETVTDITYNTAVANGTIQSVGSSKVDRYGFCYSHENTSPTIDDMIITLGDASDPKSFSGTLTDLESNTKYYVRAYAENQEGVAYSVSTRHFTTSDLPKLAEVTTGEASKITDKTAVVSGSVQNLGSVSRLTAHGHVWNTTGNPTLSRGENTDLGELSTTSSFSSTLEGLEAGTTYYVKAYATNEKGTAYGEEITFTTAKKPVLLVTGGVTGVTKNSAEFSATITSNDGHSILEREFRVVDLEDDNADEMFFSASDDFTATATGLKSDNEYFVKAYVYTSDGIWYSSDNYEVFRTLAAPTNPTNGLYAYYTFENNTTNTVSGAPNGSGINTSYVDGVQDGKALKFTSSSSKLNIPEAMIDNSIFSISFWVKGINDGHVFDVVSSGQYSNSHIMGMKNGQLTYVQSGYNLWYRWYEDNYATPFTHSAIDSSEWHLITMTSDYDGIYTDLCLYIDGEFVDTMTFYGQDYQTIDYGTKFVFGGELKNSGYSVSLNWSSMSIDNLRIYKSKVLTAQEVKQIYEYEK